MVSRQVDESMAHKPKAKGKGTAASSEAGKVRATRAAAPSAAARSKTKSGAGSKAASKSQAVKSRLKGAKTVAAVVKSKTVAKASTAKAAKAKPSVKVEKPTVAARPVAVSKSLPIKTRKPKTPLLAAKEAKFALGQVVKHRIYAFRGVVFDIDPVFSNTEDWWLAIPADVRPRKDQPFYHLLAENDETEYIAYVSEQNLIADTSGQPLRHPQLQELFVEDDEGRLRAVFMQPN